MKTKLLSRYLLLALYSGILLFTSCKKEDSDDVNQDKIYAEYELFYDQNQDKTYASAVFKFSNALGTNLQLTSPSEVRFGTDVIPFDAAFAYYRKEYSGKINSGTFKFTDTEGTAYTNTVYLADTLANPAIDSISKSVSYTYTWLGSSVAANNTVGLTLSNVASPLNAKYFLQYTTGANNLVLGAADLNYLPNGPTTCHLERTIETVAPSVTSAGGKIRGKYKAWNRTVIIKN